MLTSGSQIITDKTLNTISNIIETTILRSSLGIVDIGSSPPASGGKALTALTPTSASWQISPVGSCGFNARITGIVTQPAATSIVEFPDVSSFFGNNPSGAYNINSGIWTAPADGFYDCSAWIASTPSLPSLNLGISIITSIDVVNLLGEPQVEATYYPGTPATPMMVSTQLFHLKLPAGTTVHVLAYFREAGPITRDLDGGNFGCSLSF